MRKVGDALPRTLRALGIARRTHEAQALWLWPQILGADLVKEAPAIRLAGGTLWVSASSTALAHQLHLERSVLIERLNTMIGAPVVREIRFRQIGVIR